MNNTTYSAKSNDIKRQWYIIDASGKSLGRVAAEAAKLLRGKHKPTFTPNVDTGDHVIILNVKDAVKTEKKLDQNTLLVLDESHYYGVTDYELEMEVLDSTIGQKTFENFLAENNIPVRPAKKKIARMFERKQQIAE